MDEGGNRAATSSAEIGDRVSEAFGQREVCERYLSAFHPCPPDSRVGIALGTLHLQPLNALRHPPENGTCGWYIWGGADLSADPDFFSAVHVAHLVDRAPALLPFLGLAPGFRVLVAPGQEDAWFDGNLLVLPDDEP